MLVSIPSKYNVSQVMGRLNIKSNLMIEDKYANMRCQMFFTDRFVMLSYCRKFVRQTFWWFAQRGQCPDVLCRKNRILGYFFDRWKISLCCEECRLKMPLIVRSHVSSWFCAMYIALFPLVYPSAMSICLSKTLYSRQAASLPDFLP